MRPAYLLPDLVPPVRHESDIVDLRGMPRTEPPFAGFARAARSLAEAARVHLALGEMAAARRAAEEAMLVIDTIEDRRDAADVSLILGEVLLSLYEAHRARERFEHAVATFDAIVDLPRSARARVGLAKAMARLHDPTARAVLEDAGTIFEELGDEREVHAIDRLLRELESDFDGCPTSFHAYRYPLA